MNPQYTYKNTHGVFYFRLVLRNGSKFRKTEIRFSLRTRIASEARVRAIRAWLHAESINLDGCVDTVAVRTEIQSSAFWDGSQHMSKPELKSNIPELVTLSEHIKSDDIDIIQNTITRVSNDGGRIFVPYTPNGFIPDKFATNTCSIFAIHDPEYENPPTYPMEVELVLDQYVVLTTQGVNNARFSKDNTFKVDEFYSYDHDGNWTAQSGFSVRIIPSPFRVKLTEVLITKEQAETLTVASPVPTFTVSNGPERDCDRIGEELSRYSKDKHECGDWTDGTKKDNDGIFQTFVEIIGDKYVNEITKSDIRKYVDALRRLPLNRKKNPTFSGLDALKAASFNIERGGAVFSKRSVNKYIERLTGPFNEFVDEKFCPYNYFTNVKRNKITRNDKLKAREPFLDEDLRTMFEDDHSIRLLQARNHMPSRPWGLLIALFTGARASEIFSLTIEDIKMDGDTLYFDIKDREGHNRVKTDAAVRGVPVHPSLIELGFNKYVKKVKRVQSHLPLPMLFPDIAKSPDHGWARNTTRWINEKYLPKLGIKTNKMKVFHSFRHTVADKFRRDWEANPLKVSTYLGHDDDYGNMPEWQKGYGSPFSPSELLEIANTIDYDLNFDKFKKECLDKIKPVRPKTLVDKN